MSSQQADPGEVRSLIEDLERAHEAARRAGRKVDDAGAADLERVAEHYEKLQRLFDQYEEIVVDDSNFKQFIEFQEEMARFIEHLPGEIPHREVFETVDDLMQQRRLRESDFGEARDVLSPVADDVGLLEERDATQNRFEKLRQRGRRKVRELDERISELEALQQLDDADLEAPVERLRDPIEAYNDDVREAFTAFKRDASAREVLSFVDSTTAFPLVDYRAPPADLREYVEESGTGTEPIPTLLEYADYSDSKLDHYVDDPTALKRAVGTHQTYLRRLDAEPLTVAWPPLTPEQLRWRLRELIQVVGRFAPEDVVAHLRELRHLPAETDYERLRRSAVAREELTDDERKRLASGAVADELDALEAARDDLAATLDELDA